MKTNQIKNKNIFILAECSIMIALASVLSVIKLYEAPLGGAVTLFSMLPIIYISFKYGIRWGLGSGFVYSVVQLVLGLNSLAYIPTAVGVVSSILLDFILPFTVLGLAGVVKESDTPPTASRVIVGTVLAVVLRFSFHFVAGAVIWYSITKAGEWNTFVFKHGMWVYSFIYNIIYLGPDGGLVILASPAIVRFLKSASN